MENLLLQMIENAFCYKKIALIRDFHHQKQMEIPTLIRTNEIKKTKTKTHLLCIHRAKDVVRYGIMKYSEKMCESCLFNLSLNISIQLNSIMDDAITID